MQQYAYIDTISTRCDSMRSAVKEQA